MKKLTDTDSLIQPPAQSGAVSTDFSDRMAMVLMNLFVFPGTGSWMMGKQGQGVFQIFLSVMALALSAYGVFDMVINYSDMMNRISEAAEQSRFITDAVMVMINEFKVALLGMTLFVIALIWSIITVLVSQKK